MLFIVLIIKIIIYIQLNGWKNSTSIIQFVIIILLFFSILFSIKFTIDFKTQFKIKTRNNTKKIDIKEINMGSSEAIIYYISYIAPLINTLYRIESYWFDYIFLVLSIVVIFVLYTNTNLLAINPTMLLFKIKIVKIMFKFESNKENHPLLEGILMFKIDIKTEALNCRLNVDEIDDLIYFYSE